MSKDLLQFSGTDQAHLAYALEVCELGLWTLDTQTKRAWRSLKHDQIFGYSTLLPEWTYEMARAHVVEEDRAEFDAKFGNALATKTQWHFKHRICRADGIIRWIEAQGKLHVKPTGEEQFIGFVRDITELKQTELELQEGSLISMFVDHAPVAIAMFDQQMRYISVSHRWVTDFKLGKQPIIGRSHYEIFPKIPERWKEIHRRCLRGAIEKSDEDKFLLEDGSLCYLRWEVRPWRSADGNVGGIIIFSEDITERKAAEAALMQSEKNFRMLAEAMPQLVCMSRPDGQIFYVNQHWVDYTGQTLQESAGDGWIRTIHPDYLLKVQELWAQSIKSGTPYTIEARLRRKDGSFHWWLVCGMPIQDDKGCILKWFCICTDIDRIKQAEKAVLEGKAAEAANIAKSQFLAMMSHEIRTPLNVIIGFSDLLTSPGLNSLQKTDYAHRIRRNGRHLVHLIDEILDLSKIEAGELKSERVETHLSELISDVSVMMQYKAKEKALLFLMRLEQPLPQTFVTDPIRLKQILLNIMSNAIKFTEAGEVKVTVKCDTKLQVVVEDTGIGISDTQASRLFQPFTQADASITRKYGGTGLGLAVSRKLAQALGGDVVLVKSKLGKGSVFEVTIALEGAKYAMHPAQSVPSCEPVQNPFTRIDGLRILLAEDLEDNQLLVKSKLGAAGGIIDIANNGEEALMLAKAKEYDIVLMDIRMPKLDGYQATEKLRALGYPVPIIALTAHAMPEEIRRCQEVGCNGHLAKPVDIPALLELIRSLKSIKVQGIP